ncbi:MAG: molybdenum cofactor biosynthesis protein MoaE [Pseudomonadales bacterium]|nr:molybdenum cofactor biosynthesis protein MoaE [Pseudomonadales bacterium]NIX09991.1 molybdenum cofactor biosynthesis protein MoaE [Pseudomonadales bacterium]
MHSEVRIQEVDFSVAAEWEALRERASGDVGAVASFVGLVRDRDPEAEIQELYLEHYPGMTEASIQKILDETAARWPILDIVVIHRVGSLEPRDQIVFVQAAAAHRPAAFAACEFVMDYLKTDAVLWKRERLKGGERWIEATGDDRRRVARWKGGPAGEA